MAQLSNTGKVGSLQGPCSSIVGVPYPLACCPEWLEFPVDECSTCKQPAVWFSRTVGRDEAAVIYSVLRSFEDK
jgi:hypothetical protein